MSTWQRIFVVTNAIDVQVLIGNQILQCERVNARARANGQVPPLESYRRSLIRVAVKNRQELNAAAARTAADATKYIRARLAATAVRPDTGVAPHLADLIESRPLIPNTGTVGIANEDKLNRAINPNTPGYGPYWRAQEYGTGPASQSHVPPGTPAIPSQKGRQLRGYFYGPGVTGGTPPQSQYRGGGGPHPIFIPSSVRSGPRGGRGGKGVISKEIDARHFIRDGANLAAVEWRREMRRLDDAAARSLGRVIARPARRRRGRR
jgi:hypothetical protein